MHEDALRGFQRAYELSGRVELLFNIHLAAERLGLLTEAVDALERYLRGAEDVVSRSAPGPRVMLSSPARRLAAGEFHTRAWDSSGGVHCWGSNGSGQLGDGMITAGASPTPQRAMIAGAPVYRLVAKGTIEEKILQLGAKKRELVSNVLSTEGSPLEGLTKSDIDDLFSE